jgi:hypothetical protein
MCLSYTVVHVRVFPLVPQEHISLSHKAHKMSLNVIELGLPNAKES